MPTWELIAKYLAREATLEEKEKIELWINANPANKLALRNFERAIRPDRSKEPDFTKWMEEDWINLQKEVQTREHNLSIEYKLLHYWFKIAASILLLTVVGLGAWYTLHSTAWWRAEQQFAALDSVTAITLSDNSQVWLNKGSRLIVSKDFGVETRKATLEGEAYFEVSKDSQKPFILTTGVITTQVHGTAFNVEQENNGSVEVAVTEGRVSVIKEGHSVFLRDGEMGVYNHATGALLKKQNTELNVLSWKTGIIRFDSEPLQNVCSFISDYYNADVKLEDSSLEKYSITTVLDHQTLEEALTIISLTLDMKYEKKDSTIYFIK